MTRYIAASLCAFAAICAVSAANPNQPTLRSLYKKHYAKVEHRFGNGAAGRNIVRDGVNGKQGDRPAQDGEIAESIRTMRSMLAPAPVTAPTGSDLTASAYNAPDSPSGGGAGGGLAGIRQCESGGNYQTNTGNGFYGAYQFDQQTWEAAGGSGSPHTASPAEQDRVAAHWIASGHRSAWPNC